MQGHARVAMGSAVSACNEADLTAIACRLHNEFAQLFCNKAVSPSIKESAACLDLCDSLQESIT